MRVKSYQEITDNFTPEELKLAHDAIINSSLQDELYAKESPLLEFLIDTRKQEMLYDWIEDREYLEENEKREI